MTAFSFEQQTEIENLINRAIESHGTLIRQLQTFTADEDWVTPTIGGGFTADGTRPPQYVRDGYNIRLRGRLSALGATGNTIFTLPAGSRPGRDGSYLASTGSGTYSAAVVVTSAGLVQPFYSAGSVITLDGITFRWEA